MVEWTERMIDSIDQPPYYKYPSSQEVMIHAGSFIQKEKLQRKEGRKNGSSSQIAADYSDFIVHNINS